MAQGSNLVTSVSFTTVGTSISGITRLSTVGGFHINTGRITIAGTLVGVAQGRECVKQNFLVLGSTTLTVVNKVASFLTGRRDNVFGRAGEDMGTRILITPQLPSTVVVLVDTITRGYFRITISGIHVAEVLTFGGSISLCIAAISVFQPCGVDRDGDLRKITAILRDLVHTFVGTCSHHCLTSAITMDISTAIGRVDSAIFPIQRTIHSDADILQIRCSTIIGTARRILQGDKLSSTGIILPLISIKDVEGRTVLERARRSLMYNYF